jgi:hypothetical protein
MLAASAREGAATLGADTPAGARLTGMSQYLEYVSRDILRSAGQWRTMLSDSGNATATDQLAKLTGSDQTATPPR